jgi:hypothetical protein
MNHLSSTEINIALLFLSGLVILLLYLLVSFMGNVLKKNRKFLGYPNILND